MVFPAMRFSRKVRHERKDALAVERNSERERCACCGALYQTGCACSASLCPDCDFCLSCCRESSATAASTSAPG